MVDEKIFQDAVNAIEKGNFAHARDLLTGMLRHDQADPKLWLWMSAAVDSVTEKIYCLENVLKLDPGNPDAKRGLAILRGLPPGQEPAVKPLTRVKWTLEPSKEEPKGLFARIWTNPVLRIAFFSGVLLILCAIIAGVVLGIRQPEQVVVITITLRPSNTPTETATSTPTPKIRTATPTLSAGTPLSALLSATYTPTPLYVNTPHPVSEAFRIAIRAYERGDFAQMLNYMQQASEQVSDAPDLSFYVGEANRFLGKNEDALAAYENSIKLDPQFAPAYLGRALARLAIDPTTDITDDLDQAVDLDANYAEAYQQRALYYIEKNDQTKALADLKKLSELNPNNPSVPLLEARILLLDEQPEKALLKAQEALELDITLLPTYRTLAEAHLALGQFTEALGPIEVYMRYSQDSEDAFGWALLGEIRFRNNDEKGAIEALDRALELARGNAKIYYIRGEIFLAQGEAQQAINAFADGYRFNEKDFDINLGLGRALFAAERYIDAFQQLNATENLAKTDRQKAAVYYWRARILDEGGNPNVAKQNYEDLLALPEGVVPKDWIKFTKERLLVLNPPTSTPTSTITVSPTLATPQITPSPTKSSPTITPTKSNPKASPSATPTKSPTKPAASPSPTKTP